MIGNTGDRRTNRSLRIDDKLGVGAEFKRFIEQWVSKIQTNIGSFTQRFERVTI